MLGSPPNRRQRLLEIVLQKQCWSRDITASVASETQSLRANIAARDGSSDQLLSACSPIKRYFRFFAISSGQLEVDFASDQVGDRDEIAQ
jgi:hypothetical protein